MRASKVDTVTGKRMDRDRVIGELEVKDIILILMTVEPHDWMGLLMMIFLHGQTLWKSMIFKESHSNAGEMYMKTTSVPYPIGIIQHGTVN